MANPQRDLPLIFDAHGKRALETFSRLDDVLRNLRLTTIVLRRMASQIAVKLSQWRQFRNRPSGTKFQISNCACTMLMSASCDQLQSLRAPFPRMTVAVRVGDGCKSDRPSARNGGGV